MTHHPGMSIHPTALVDGAARLGKNVTIGPFTIVHANVIIGDDTVIESHCEIGHPAACSDGSPLVIGAGALIRSQTVLYEGSSFGDGLTTGHGTVIRDGTRAGLNLIVGTRGDIQGDCVIGDYVRTQSSVVIGKASKVGSFVWLFPQVSLLNDPMPPSDALLGATVEDWAVVCASTIIMPGARVGEGAFVGVGSIVRHHAPAGRILCGDPLTDKGSVHRLRLPKTRELARPWTRHFTRGYPAELVEFWAGESVHIAA